VVEGITVCSEFRGHDRFLPVIQGVSMNDSQMKVFAARCLLTMFGDRSNSSAVDS